MQHKLKINALFLFIFRGLLFSGLRKIRKFWSFFYTLTLFIAQGPFSTLFFFLVTRSKGIDSSKKLGKNHWISQKCLFWNEINLNFQRVVIWKKRMADSSAIFATGDKNYSIFCVCMYPGVIKYYVQSSPTCWHSTCCIAPNCCQLFCPLKMKQRIMK